LHLSSSSTLSFDTRYSYVKPQGQGKEAEGTKGERGGSI
jgi:hypothetical protein